jgi:hypothetical protein
MKKQKCFICKNTTNIEVVEDEVYCCVGCMLKLINDKIACMQKINVKIAPIKVKKVSKKELDLLKKAHYK